MSARPAVGRSHPILVALPALAVMGFAVAGPVEGQDVEVYDTVRALAGAVDVHVHSYPDTRPRSMNAMEVARLAGSRGMRAVVLKNHDESTAGLAYIVSEEVPDIEVFGGIALNLAVGGVNLAAVENMARVSGGHGRIVWLPTFDADRVPVSSDGELLPEVKDVIAFVAENGLALATGHVTPEEVMMVLREARERGVRSSIVTHPVGRLSVEQMKAAAAAGGFIEITAGPQVQDGEDASAKAERFAPIIREVGPEHVILASDLGQEPDPFPPDGFAEFLIELHERGFSVEELDLMAKGNPAELLGLTDEDPPLP